MANIKKTEDSVLMRMWSNQNILCWWVSKNKNMLENRLAVSYLVKQTLII